MRRYNAIRFFLCRYSRQISLSSDLDHEHEFFVAFKQNKVVICTPLKDYLINIIIVNENLLIYGLFSALLITRKHFLCVLFSIYSLKIYDTEDDQAEILQMSIDLGLDNYNYCRSCTKRIGMCLVCIAPLPISVIELHNVRFAETQFACEL